MATQRSAENVQVVVRCRPLNQQELAEKVAPVISTNETSKEVTIEVKGRNLTKTFTYDSVYSSSASQRDVYNVLHQFLQIGTVLPIVQEVLDGYNCTIFAYGQTGTGKTYTMEGNRDTEDTSQLDSKARLKASREAGIISRAINTIFEHLTKTSDEYTVKVSHLELYNEDLFDLLDPDNKSLKVFEDPANPTASITVRGLTEVNVYSTRDIFNILEKSWTERTTAETNLNKESSRSHCIFSITIHTKERNIEGEDLLKVGKLNLVDLAGSENVGKSGMSAKTAGRQEAGMINKSLLAFGRVITALVDQSPHVPYRESKLTRILQDSLGGRTKTCIIATISPASLSLDETIGTLEYAHRAKSIKNQPQVNAKLSKKEFLGDYAKEIDDFRTQLDAMRRKDGVYIPHDQYIQLSGDLKQKVEEIESLLEEKKVKEKEFEEMHEVFDLQALELRDIKDILQTTQATLDGTMGELSQTLATLEATRDDLGEHKVVLAERAHTEAKFHQQSTALLHTLAESLLDIEALYAKVSREEELASSNRSSWSEMKEEINARLIANEAIVHDFVASQSNQLDILSDNIQSFGQSKQENVKTLQVAIGNLNELIESRRKEIVEFIDTSLTSAQARKDGFCRAESSNISFASKNLSALHGAIDGKVNTLVTTISSYDQRTKAWSEGKESELKEAISVVHQFSELQKQKMESLRVEALAKLEAEVTNFTHNRNKLATFIEQQKKETRDFQSTVLSSVTVLLADFVSRKEQALDLVLEKFTQNFETRAAELVRFRGDVDSVISQFASNLENFDKENATKSTTIIEGVKKMGEITSGICKINAEQARQISTSSSVEVSLLKELSDVHQKSFEEKLAETEKTLAASFENQKLIMARMVDDSAHSAVHLGRGLSGGLESTKSEVSKWSDEIKFRTKESSSFEESWTSDLRNAGNIPRQYELTSYKSKGGSPTKKLWSYRTELSHTRSDSDIINQYRNTGEFVPVVDPLAEARRIAEASLRALRGEPLIELEVPVEESAVEPVVVDSLPEIEPKIVDKEKISGPAKGKPKPLHPVNPASLPRGNAKPFVNAINVPLYNKGPTKVNTAGRENPKPLATSTVTSAKPVLKRQNSQQQLVGALSRKAGDSSGPSKPQ